MVFGRLKVIERYKDDYITPSTGKRQSKWVCLCECGNTVIVAKYQLLYGHTKSCGCYQRQRSKEAHTKHGGRYSRLHCVWANMKNRCFNPNYSEYKDYGGRGITVCDEWLEYDGFRKWAFENGYDENAKRGKCTLDRIDIDGNYCPENCRFVDMYIQANNKQYNIRFEYNGEKYSLSELSKLLNKPYDYLYYRLVTKGMSLEEIL